MGRTYLKYLIEYDDFSDNAEYSFRYTDTSAQMYFSDTDCNWTESVKGTKCGYIEEVEDSILINISKDINIELDFAQLEELYVLLQFYMKEVQDSNPKIYKLEKELVN